MSTAIEETIPKPRVAIPDRLLSVDALRAITMLLMIFVNDLWSLTGIPVWLGHAPMNVDAMGFADIVFPAFLLIVGMSIPFAIQNRRLRGDSKAEIVTHIFLRAVSLIIMGLFLVNGEHLNERATGMDRLVWNCLSCSAFILIWNNYPQRMDRRIVRGLKSIGIVILIALFFLCRQGQDGTEGFSIYWWGILGLIGWAYLAAALIFVAGREDLRTAIIAFVIFNGVCVVSHSGVADGSSFYQLLVQPVSGGGLPAIVATGVLVSVIFLRMKSTSQHGRMTILLVLFSAALVALAFATRSYWGISKILATPSWIWISSAVTIGGFLVVYWIADVGKNTRWVNPIRPAGTNTLLCYLLPHFAYALIVFSGLQLPAVMLTGYAGLLKSFAFALLIVWLTGRLSRIGLQLRL